MNGEYRKWMFYEVWDLIEKYGIDAVREAVNKMEKKYDIHS